MKKTVMPIGVSVAATTYVTGDLSARKDHLPTYNDKEHVKKRYK